MSKTPLARAVALATLGASLTLPSLAQADFIGDSKATLELRNFYMNRDLRDPGVAQSKREEWAQGFILKAESGFTEGTVGFGLDAYAGLGLKLDSSDERAGTGLLPVGDSAELFFFPTVTYSSKQFFEIPNSERLSENGYVLVNARAGVRFDEGLPVALNGVEFADPVADGVPPRVMGRLLKMPPAWITRCSPPALKLSCTPASITRLAPALR